MRINKLKKLFFNNTLLKIVSLVLGYSFWYITSLDAIITAQITVPLCFTNASHNYSIEAPETVSITLSGKRADMYALEKENIAAHINIDAFYPGKYGIIITEQHLFLPKDITLVRYTPSNLYITINSQQTL